VRSSTRRTTAQEVWCWVFAFCLSINTLWAAQITQTFAIANEPLDWKYPWSGKLFQVQKFNPSLGTLTGVRMSISRFAGTETLSVQAYQQGGDAAVDTEVSASLSLADGSGAPVGLPFASTGWNWHTDIQGLQPGVRTTVTTSFSCPATGFSAAPGILASFVGSNASYGLLAQTDSHLVGFIPNPGDVSEQVVASLTVEVVYEYTPVCGRPRHRRDEDCWRDYPRCDWNWHLHPRDCWRREDRDRDCDDDRRREGGRR